MQVKLKPNKKIFTGYLAINAAGYNYENNPKGMHKIRLLFRDKSHSIKDESFNELVRTIKQTDLKSNQYPRIINMLFGSDVENNHFQREINEFMVKILKSHEIDALFEKYCKVINELKIRNYNEKDIKEELLKVLRLFSLRKDLITPISFHLNLLESYSRGTNYFNDLLFSVSLNFDDQAAFRVLRHEFIHLVLKTLLKDVSLKLKNVPIGVGYENDDTRTKFDENFTIAANLFFEPENTRPNHLKYLKDSSFSRVQVFYDFIDDLRASNKKLNAKELNNLSRKFNSN